MRSIAELQRLHGRCAVVTGGAGHIGRAIADAYAELGAHVVLIDHSEDAVREVAEAISVARGVPVLPLAVDLANEAATRDIPRQVDDHFGRLDILVHSAAFVGTSSLAGWAVPFAEQSTDAWRQALEVNLTAPFALTQAAAEMLRQSGHGSVICIGSIYGVVGPDLRIYEGTKLNNPAAYAASKGGLMQWVRWLATVLAPAVRVNAISPGGIFRHQPQSFVDAYIARTPLGRMGTEEDLKGAAVFLASDLSAYVTGQNLLVDGGWTAW